MAAEPGSGFLLKAGDGGSPAQFTTVAGLRATAMTVNSTPVDVTHKDSGGWRALLDGAGLRRVSVSASGVFMNAGGEALVRDRAFSGAGASYRLVFANGDQAEGPFHVTALTYSGDHDGERSYTIALDSAGPVTFTPGSGL